MNSQFQYTPTQTAQTTKKDYGTPIGNVSYCSTMVKDAELKTSNNNAPYIRISVPVIIRASDGAKEVFVNATFYGSSAYFYAALRKGDGIKISGNLYMRNYESNGNQMTSYDINNASIELVDKFTDVTYLDRFNQQQQEQPKEQPKPDPQGFIPATEEDGALFV